MEIWKDITGYEGKYQISNLGKAKRLRHQITRIDGKIVNLKERFLTLFENKKGYKIIQLSKDSKSKSYILHRLVGMYPNYYTKVRYLLCRDTQCVEVSKVILH